MYSGIPPSGKRRGAAPNGYLYGSAEPLLGNPSATANNTQGGFSAEKGTNRNGEAKKINNNNEATGA